MGDPFTLLGSLFTLNISCGLSIAFAHTHSVTMFQDSSKSSILYYTDLLNHHHVNLLSILLQTSGTFDFSSSHPILLNDPFQFNYYEPFQFCNLFCILYCTDPILSNDPFWSNIVIQYYPMIHSS